MFNIYCGKRKASRIQTFTFCVALGRVFSEYFCIPCQFSFHGMLQTLMSTWAVTVDTPVAGVPNGLSLTPTTN
jgi:hypothetical protein